MTRRERLKAELESIGEDYRSPYGICELLSADLKTLFLSIAVEWPEYSGSLTFPVPHHFCGPVDAYCYTNAEEKWNPECPYGAARWRLVRWCIEQLSERETQ